ncbi:hypothetical protein RND71_038662 [Anisodus tanguticus]|uniref:Protein kinase domain-containing protein n=1 Tax=Anisodus tanguticus TaxID=243964 RepID=A0AAE1R0I6_9SOLA|nr:hypothetical protein RND71_038662 [Anisodus tanguticus]
MFRSRSLFDREHVKFVEIPNVDYWSFDLNATFRRFTYTELKKATKNFKVELGRGGSGAVYERVLADGRAVAVKKLANDHFQKEFLAEMTTIGRINHMHLVRMMVKRKIQSGEDSWVEKIVDPRLEGKFSKNQAITLIEIGLSCVEQDRNKRPTMASVVQTLLDCEDITQLTYM